MHPLRVESVAWATERRDVLSGLFFLATVYGYLRAQRMCRRYRTAPSGWRSALIRLRPIAFGEGDGHDLAGCAVVAGYLPAKKIATANGRFGFNPAMRDDSLAEAAISSCWRMLFSVFALFAQESAGALRPVQNYFASYRFGQAFYGLCFYLWKTRSCRLPLSPLYELPYDFAAWMPLFLACGATVVAMSLVSFMLRRRWPALLACWVYYLVVVAPVLGVAQSGPQLVADRYSYLSCLSWALLAGRRILPVVCSAGSGTHRIAMFDVRRSRRSGKRRCCVILEFSHLETRPRSGATSETLWSHVNRGGRRFRHRAL